MVYKKIEEYLMALENPTPPLINGKVTKNPLFFRPPSLIDVCGFDVDYELLIVLKHLMSFLRRLGGSWPGNVQWVANGEHF